MHPHLLYYSIDPNITISNLKKNKIPDWDTSKLEKWIKENSIWWLVKWETNYHYKFLLIKSKPYIIYYKWNIDLLNRSILAIVWPRLHTQYSVKILEKRII